MIMWTIARRDENLAGALSTVGALTGDVFLYGDREGVPGQERAQRALDLLLAPDKKDAYEVIPVEVSDCPAGSSG